MRSLHGPDDNKDFIENGFRELARILPCQQSYAIQWLHFKTGHSTDYVRTEVIYTFVEVGYIVKKDTMLVSLTPAGKQYLKELERKASNNEQDDESHSNEKESHDRKVSIFAKQKVQKDDGELPTDENGNHIRPESKAEKKNRASKDATEKTAPDNSPYYCRTCKTDYGSQSVFKEHVKLKHFGEKQ
ncbi:MAG: hypothetical protein JRN15_13990 [Nitrososphaerota archaeon]|nr:hypothetical protein [Nitrososphaerota archaeon]